MFSNYRNSKFLKSVSTLTYGTVIANVVTVLASVFLTRIFTPQEIGFLTLFNSISIVLANLFTLGYELAIVVPEKNKTALEILTGAFVLLLVCSFTLLLIIISILFLEIQVDITLPFNWILYLPLAVFLLGIINISQEWYTRSENFALLSQGKIYQSLSTSITQISIGYFLFANVGLVIGFTFGRLISSLLYVYNFIKNKASKLKVNHSVLDTLKEYKAYPKYISLTIFIDRLSLEAPYFLISFLFTENLLGFYAIAYRVLSVPMTFIGAAIGQVFFKFLSTKKHSTEKLTPVLIKAWSYLALIGVIPMGIIVIGGENLFGFVFGEEWAFSGTLAKVLVPMLYIDFISSPTGRSFLVLELERYTPFFSLARILYIILSIYIGFLYSNIVLAILLLSVSRAIALIIQNIILYVKAHQYDNQ